MHTLNPFIFIVVPSKVKLFYILHTALSKYFCLLSYYVDYALCMHYAYSTCLTFDITSGYTQLFSLLLGIAFSFFVTNNMAGNGLEPEQLIEIVDSTNNFIGYVSGTLPNVVIDDNIVILDHTDANHDDSECNSDTLSIGPEAPSKIPSDKDIVTIDRTHTNHDDSDGDSDSESDSDTLSIGPDAPPNIPSDTDNTLSSQESSNDETKTYEIIDELLTEDNGPATPAIPIVNYPGNVENADDYANGWEWQLEDRGSSCGPFLLDSKLNKQLNANQPETF